MPEERAGIRGEVEGGRLKAKQTREQDGVPVGHPDACRGLCGVEPALGSEGVGIGPEISPPVLDILEQEAVGAGLQDLLCAGQGDGLKEAARGHRDGMVEAECLPPDSLEESDGARCQQFVQQLLIF